MPEVANCPLCSKEPLLFYLDNELVAISHCGVSCSSLTIWNKIAAAMELAQLEVEFENCESEDEHKYQEMIEWARKDVLEVFK